MDNTSISELKKLINGFHIVAVTFPCRYHITTMTNLSTVLASKGISVTFIVTEDWLGFVSSLFVDSPNIRIHSIPNVVPSEGADAPKADFMGFIEAVYTKMEAPFCELLDQLDQPVSCIVADSMLPLWTMAPSVFSIYYHLDLLAAHGQLPT